MQGRLMLVSLAAALGVGVPAIGDDDAYTPPKLPLFDRSIDYFTALASGTLAPDRIILGDRTVRVGSSEDHLIAVLGKEFEVSEPPTARDQPEQSQYTIQLGRRYPDSMHYYILANVHYNRKLHGEFKVLTWKDRTIAGDVRAYLHRTGDTSRWTAWLLQISFGFTEPVRSLSGDLNLVRGSEELVRWDARSNRVYVTLPE